MILIQRIVFNLVMLWPVSIFYKKYQLGKYEKNRRRLFPLYEKEFRYLPAILCQELNWGEQEFTSTQSILDVGGNMGQSAFALRRIFPNALINSIEPNPLIESAISRNPLANWQVLNIGLMDRKSEITLYTPVYKDIYFTGLTSDDNLASTKFISTKKIWNYRERLLKFYEFSAQAVTLDSLQIEPRLIKIDTEGMEISILKGAIKTIERCKPVFMIECLESFNEVKCFMHKYGYEAFELTTGNQWHHSEGVRINQIFLPIARQFS